MTVPLDYQPPPPGPRRRGWGFWWFLALGLQNFAIIGAAIVLVPESRLDPIPRENEWILNAMFFFYAATWFVGCACAIRIGYRWLFGVPRKGNPS